MRKLLVCFISIVMLSGCANNSDITHSTDGIEEKTNVGTTSEDNTLYDYTTEYVADTNTTEAQTVVNKSNEYCSIDGIYIDNSFKDKGSSNMKMMYVFYTVNASKEKLSVSSKYSKIVTDNDTYKSEKYTGTCDYMRNYYYSDYIEEVSKGKKLKVVATFKLPSEELKKGNIFEFKPDGADKGDSIILSTDDILTKNSTEAIAKDIDLKGYNEYVALFDKVDDATRQSVRNALNGYQFEYYVNGTWYVLEFFEPNNFEIRVKALGVTNGGTYTVRKGVISIKYSEGKKNTVNIPWSWKDGDINLDCVAAFDVNENRYDTLVNDWEDEAGTTTENNQGTTSTTENNQGTTSTTAAPETERVGYTFYVPEGSQIFNDHAYYIVKGAMTWTQANEFSKQMGGYLATITSQEEQDFIDNTLNVGNDPLWIGGYRDDDGVWKWITGEAFSYTNWGEGEPNNSSEVIGNERYVAVWPRKWNDLADTNIYDQWGFIVKFDPIDKS